MYNMIADIILSILGFYDDVMIYKRFTHYLRFVRETTGQLHPQHKWGSNAELWWLFCC